MDVSTLAQPEDRALRITDAAVLAQLEPASHVDYLVLDTKDFFGWGQKVIGNDELTMRIAVAYFEARIAEAVANDSMERFQKERARIAEAAHHAVTAPLDDSSLVPAEPAA